MYTYIPLYPRKTRTTEPVFFQYLMINASKIGTDLKHTPTPFADFQRNEYCNN